VKKVFILFISLLLFVSCSSNKPQIKKSTNDTRFSCKTSSQFIESYDAGNFLLRAKGKGKSILEVKEDAKKDALCYALIKGNHSILDNKKKRNNFSKYADEIYADLDIYTSIKGREKSRSQEDGLYVFEYIVEVNEKNLRKDLAEIGVITDVKKLNKSLGNQSFMVIRNKENNFAVSVMEKYLIDRKFNLVNHKPINKKSLSTILSVLTDIYGGEEDFVNKKYANILNSGSDVFVEVEANIFHSKSSGVAIKQASVNIKAYESATNKIIASKMGHSPQRATANINALIEEATNDVANKITKSVSDKWEDYLEDGKPIRVLMVSVDADNFTNIGNDFYNALKSLSENVQLLSKGVVANDYLIQVKNIKKSSDLFEQINKTYRGDGKLFMEIAVNNFLIIKIGSSDFMIETLN